MDLNFKEFINTQGSAVGLNAPGRAGEHVWKPKLPPTHDPHTPQIEPIKSPKGARLDRGFRPLPPAQFKGLTGEDFGIKKIRSPKPNI